MNFETCYSANGQLVASEVFDREAIVMNLNDGMYYTLSGTGAEIWTLIECAHPISSIAQHLVDRHGITEAQANADLKALLGELTSENLIVASDPNPEPLLTEQVEDFGTYGKAVLEHHKDMTDVLAMDPPLPEPVAVVREGD